MSSTQELVVGCVCLVASGWWWFGARGPIWDGWRNILATLATVVGPVLVYRAWKRRPEEAER